MTVYRRVPLLVMGADVVSITGDGNVGAVVVQRWAIKISLFINIGIFLGACGTNAFVMFP